MSTRSATSDGVRLPPIVPQSHTQPFLATFASYTAKEPHIEEIFNRPSVGNAYDYGNCTYYVSSQIAVPQNLGNANTWATTAQSEGYTVSNTPYKGAVAVSTAGFYGHVALVESVAGLSVTISEMNVFGLGVVDERVVPVADYVYVYFGTF